MPNDLPTVKLLILATRVRVSLEPFLFRLFLELCHFNQCHYCNPWSDLVVISAEAETVLAKTVVTVA
jgi:hypothetical protein